MPVWYHDKKNLKEGSPSLSSGLDYTDEIRYRREGARFIQELGKSLGLRHDTMATASIYFHRFYLFHSFISFPRYVTAACALFLAGKAEETPKKCRDIIKNVKELLNPNQFNTFGQDPREEVMTLERVLLQTIKFDLQVDHPYSSILKYAKCLKGDNNKLQKMVQMSWTFVNDSLCTTLCLQWEPEVIAIALMYLAAKLSKFEVKDWKNRKDDHRYWWDQYVQNLNTEILEDICHQVLDLYSSPAKNAKEAPPSPPPGSRPPPVSSTPRNTSLHKENPPQSAKSYKQALMTGNSDTPISSRPDRDRKPGSLKSSSKQPPPPPSQHDGPMIAVAAPLPSQQHQPLPSKPSAPPPQPSGKPPPMPPSAPPPISSLPPIVGLPQNMPPQVVAPPPPVTPSGPMMYPGGSSGNYAGAANIPRNQQTAMFQTGYAYQAHPPGLVPHNAPPPNLSAPPPSGHMPSVAPPSRPPIVSTNTPGSGGHQYSSPMNNSSGSHRHHPPPSTSNPPPIMSHRGPPPNVRGGPPPNLRGPPPDTSRGPPHHAPPPSHHGGRSGTPTKDLGGGGRGGHPPMMNMSPALRPLSTTPQPMHHNMGGGMGGSTHTPSPLAGGVNTPRGPYPQMMGGGKMQGQQGGNNQHRNTPYQRNNYQQRPPHGGGGGQRWNN